MRGRAWASSSWIPFSAGLCCDPGIRDPDGHGFCNPQRSGRRFLHPDRPAGAHLAKNGGVVGLRSLVRDPMAFSGLLLIALILSATLFAPWLAPHDPVRLDTSHRLQGPSSVYLLGTDYLGRCVAVTHPVRGAYLTRHLLSGAGLNPYRGDFGRHSGGGTRADLWMLSSWA